MRRGLLCLLTLAAGLPAAVRADPGPPPPVEPPPPPPRIERLPPHYMCVVTRELEFGTIGIQQTVSPAGETSTRLGTWETTLAPDGVMISASWEYPDPARYSLVWLIQTGLDPHRSYRINVRREVPTGQSMMLLQSPLTRPDPEGTLHVWTIWEAMTAMLAGADDPRIILTRDDNTVMRDHVVDPAIFARVLGAVPALQPEFDAMVADYRNRCRFSESNHLDIPLTPPEPNVVPDQIPGR